MTMGFSTSDDAANAPAERMTGSQAIVRTLEDLGVTDVFYCLVEPFCRPMTPCTTPRRSATSWSATSRAHTTQLRATQCPVVRPACASQPPVRRNQPADRNR